MITNHATQVQKDIVTYMDEQVKQYHEDIINEVNEYLNSIANVLDVPAVA